MDAILQSNEKDHENGADIMPAYLPENAHILALLFSSLKN